MSWGRIARVVLTGAGLVLATGTLHARQQPAAPAALRSGEELYRNACATCHGADGQGSPRTVVGFDTPLPDFSDCAFASGEPDPDWFAVVHEGGPVRALDRHMPAFGDALSAEEIRLAISHIRTFCSDAAWPQGDLNLPRAFFTEKAFPENEAVWSMSMTGGRERVFDNELVYERRLGSRSQVEFKAPVSGMKTASGDWQGGVGDVAFALKRTLHASMRRGHISAAGVEVILPTGDAARGFGAGHAVFEPFAMWGQLLPRDSYFQVHAGMELPADSQAGREGFVRAALGTTIAADRGFGRAFSPQVEVLWAKPEGEPAEWDVVPQIQVSLSKLQHVLIAAGVRVPVSQRSERRSQALVYLLWDWFDGGLFEMWR